MTTTEEHSHERKPIPPAEELEQLPADGGPEYNRLVFEQSPYLLQHAGNPIDWYPWGPAAFDKAKTEDKPIFLSVGYTTCHWCHVMERESFEDDEVAKILNEHFVCIKVDREERPDVDKIYMDITQAMTGSGGWPMTVVMTPARKPFFAGTYFPKENRGGRVGMLELLPQLAAAWENDRDKVLEVAERAAGALVQINAGAPGDALGEATLEGAYEELSRRFDERHGGFSSAPKFPTPHVLAFLLRYWKRSGEARALDMVEKTLVEMRQGGIFDHVGYGFHRYSTDPQWLLPHFEKMLYDQALHVLAYLEAFQATGKAIYEKTAREVLTYVLRDMTSPKGGFYSAEDADSEGEEGTFYVWTLDEVREVLGPEDGDLYIRAYNAVEGGNFRDQATGQQTGGNIPHLQKSIPELAHDFEMGEDELRARLEAARLNLFAARENRVHPQKDDKILTDWNGLMIAAMAKAGQVLGDSEYRAAAEAAADFVLNELRTPEGRLLKRYRRGHAGLTGLLDDYAFFVYGLLDVYETNGDPRYLREADALTRTMIEQFWDDERGGLYLTPDDGEKLLVRGKDIVDGAIPSGNSVAYVNLLRLARMTGNTEYEERAESIVKAFAAVIERSPSNFALLLQGLDFAVGPAYEVVLAGDRATEGFRAMRKTLAKHFVPNKVVLIRDGGTALADLAPFTKEMAPVDGAATAYVCRNFACKLPTTSAEEMMAHLGIAGGGGTASAPAD